MDKSESVIDSMGHQFSQSNMPSIKISKKHHKHINNPFPGTPKSLPFVHGNLFCNSQTFKQHQVFQVGIDFLLTWSPENGGSLSISHQSQPNRTIWSTVPGQAFVSAAMAETEVEESRGSFVIKDGEVSFICQHQSIEDIKMINEFDIGHDEDHDFPSGSLRLIQETDFSEQFKEAQFPVLLITGKIFNSKKKKKIERSINRYVDFETKKFKYGRVGKVTVSAKYWFFLYQENAHQIGFRVKFGKPISKFHQRTLPRDSRSLWSLKWKWGKFRKRRIGWFTNTGGYAKISAEEREVKVGEGTEFNRVFMTYSSEEDEKFYGFGEQFSHMEFKGRRVPIFVQEQGIGRGDQPITFAANLVSYRSGGDWSTTYAPSPFYMTSKMRSLYLEGYSYSVFDLTKHDRIQIQIYSGNAQGRIIYGNSPTELIERFTETIGRPPELPNWIISGAVVGMQGGTESVRRVWDQLQEYDAPISAFWLQDWVGQRETIIGSQLWWNWEVDTTRYAGWLKLVNDLRAHGIRMMAYCNPCLAPTGDKPNTTRNLFEEANKLGIFVKDKTGETYMIPNTAFEVGMLDFTNPAASSWFKQILWEMVDSGVMGWMADFGEGLPLDACLFSGEDPVSAHNRYPEIWAKINREFVDEWKSKHYAKEREDPEESLVFFVRAGFRESPKWAMLFWEGDQMVSWQKNDGIKSAVVGLLSSGLSGYALNHSDIGGYCAVNIPFVKYRRSEELLLRWMELNAFSTVFRTHEGNNPSANIQFYSNHRTLSQFARFAKVYEAWKFYRIQLVKEAAHKGLPVSRHLFLHFPNDKHVHNLTYQQFLVGTEILVAPVLDKGKEEVKVYFPLGGGCSWQHIWTGKVYSGPLNCSDNKSQGFETWVEARIGFPAVFVKFGSPIGKTFQKNLKDLNIL